MLTYDVLNDVLRFRNIVDDFFNESGTSGEQKNYPLVQIREKNDELEISALVPGVALEDIDLNLVDTSLHIEINKKNDYTDNHYIRKERLFGKFKKSVQLPFRVDHDRVEAVLDNGILKIKLIKSEEAKPKKITIK